MSALHGDAIVADGHNDLLMLVARRPRETWAGYFRDRWIPQLRDGGVDVQVLPVLIDDEFRPEGRGEPGPDPESLRVTSRGDQ